MKRQIVLFLLFFSIFSATIFSQIRIGGSISIDINLPIPDVVIVGKSPKRVPVPQPEQCPIPREKRHRCNDNCNHNNVFSYGEIQNQNGSYGNERYSVLDAHITLLQNREEIITYELDSGDVLELFIVTINPNDYNYHTYSNSYSCNKNNHITKVVLNGKFLDLRNGSLSLQPRGNNGFHSVLNIHSVYEGDFNGSVNF